MANRLDGTGAAVLPSRMANHLDQFFTALGDPTRRAVVERLTRGPAPVSELHAPHDIALPTFLRHLRVLEDAGLLRSEKRGRVRTCHIEATPLHEIETWLDRQRRTWERRLDRLSALAEEIDRTGE